MSDFMNFILSYLVQALAGLVFVAVAGVVILRAAVKRHKCKYGAQVPFPWMKAVLLLMLAAYLAVVLFVTIRSGGYYTGAANFHLFRGWREAWNSFSERQWMNVLLNIALFVPLGILLPLIWKRMQKWYLMLPAGFLTSLFIEIMQYLRGSGLFDVDDLFNNTLGAVVGFWLVMAAVSLWQKRWKKGACHMLALIAAAAAISGVFIAYEVQEYGNLSTSPAFRVDTKHVQWTVSCDLSDQEQTVDIYKTQPWTREACEAFGRKFFENLGITEVDVTIYNDEVYMREHLGNRILEVFYQGGCYSFRDLENWDEEACIRVEETELREALKAYGIEIPAAAEYACPDGKTHSFHVDHYVQGDTMLDGTITVQWKDGFGIQSIENDLLSVTYYGADTIQSAKAAVQRLMDGYIASGDWFERKDPRNIEVISCELSYQVDTKGFYQPVYLIRLVSPDTGFEATETVPALK